MLKIGLTGGIGSGKTTIANIFSTLGVPVYDADSAAKRLMSTNNELRQQIIANFGEQTYINNQLNRTYLSSIVFNNEEKLKELNAIIHPITIQDAQNWFARQGYSYAIKEAALIFESGSEKYLDYVIGVWAPKELRLKRTLQRSSITADEVNKRMAKQMDEEEKMKLCSFVINNDESASIIQQVFELHQTLKKLSGS